MLARTQIGVEEYLGLVFNDRPEPDYVHGEVVERALPTPIHSQIQAALILLLAPLRQRMRLFLLPELRVQIEPRLFRVADLAVYRESLPQGRYATIPAYLAVEIVSPDDRHSELTERLEELPALGGTACLAGRSTVEAAVRILRSGPAAACKPGLARIRLRNLFARALQRHLVHFLRHAARVHGGAVRASMMDADAGKDADWRGRVPRLDI